MKIIVGIGNPGEKYKNNRHNVGFMVIDALASKVFGSRWLVNSKLHSTLYTVHGSLIFAKPLTFMNSSGTALKKLITRYKVKPSDLWVIHDDLDLHLGGYKFQFGKGPKIHKGLLSIYEELETKKFWHVRVGVDNRTNNKEQRTKGEEYVLQDFREDEIVERDKVIQDVVGELIKRVVYNN